MKKKLFRPLALLSILAAALGCLALAAYSVTGQEMVSLRYLQEVFLPETLQKGEEVLQAGEDSALEQVKAQIEAENALYDFQLGTLDGSLSHSDSLTDQRFKEADVLTLAPGCEVLLLAGEAVSAPVTGTLLDLTEGIEVAPGTSLLPNRRYLAAERSMVAVTVTSNTAVLCPNGSYQLTPGDTVDYNELADALKELGLFKGSDTGYGSGYDLEAAPTRIQGLILFLRLIGEEADALASTAPCPFTDVPAWAAPYVAYAYEKNYTKGMSETTFAPSLPLRSSEYLTFLLRALGYRDSGENPDFAWDTALSTALELGLLDPYEHKVLTEEPFLRAQVAYVSYYALDAHPKGSPVTLADLLSASGVLDPQQVKTVRASVTSPKIGP